METCFLPVSFLQQQQVTVVDEDVVEAMFSGKYKQFNPRINSHDRNKNVKHVWVSIHMGVNFLRLQFFPTI